MKRKYKWAAVLVAPWLLAASLPVAAATIYKLNGGNCASGLQTSCSDTTTTPAGGPGVTYSAVSDTGATVSGNKTLAGALVGGYLPNLGVTSKAGPNAAANGTSPYGTGENAPGNQETTSSPQHAMDNNGNSEFMLLTFGSAVTLNYAQLGWAETDSDLTVLAYNGAAGGQGLTGKSYGGATTGLIAAGWSLIGNYANVYDTTTNANINGTPTSLAHTVAINTVASSSYWLIGAYSNAFGGKSLSTGNDYVKLLAVYGTPGGGGGGQQVPEPSSMLLAGIALFGLTALRRRRAI